MKTFYLILGLFSLWILGLFLEWWTLDVEKVAISDVIPISIFLMFVAIMIARLSKIRKKE